jgi:hypothetical protein
MNTVHITESNFKSIARECPPEYQDTQYIEDLYKREICSLLCKREKDVIASVKVAIEAFQDYDEFFKIFKFEEKPNLKFKRKNNTRLIYLGGSPAYHKNQNCNYLNSSYKNYEIPVEVSEEKIEDYRKFFVENIEVYKNDRNVFFARVELKFNIIIRNVREFSAQNSGTEQLLNFDSEPEHALLTKIHSLGCEMVQYRFSDDFTKNVISKYGAACHLVVNQRDKYTTTDTEHKVIGTWLNYKTELKKLMTKHLIIKLNPELKFDKRCLDYFGFRQCSDCYTSKAIT